MKYLMLTILIASPALAHADEYVHGYTRGDGTYVRGYERSSPDGTTENNFSHYGNVNPYTGEIGDRRD